MFTTMTSFLIILCLSSLLLVNLQVTDASLVVFLVTELLAAMPNQNIANNAEVEVWLDEVARSFSNPDVQKDRKGQVLSRVPRLKTIKIC